MTDSQPTRPPRPSRLLTREEVIARLRREREELGLTKTAVKYGIAVQQINDVLAGRAGMSKRMYTKLRYKLYERFERLPE